MSKYKPGDEYYVECHTSFTYSNGEIITDVNEFNVICVKGNLYKMTIELKNLIVNNTSSNYLSCWIKYSGDDVSYGPGVRLMFEGDSGGWINNHYSDFFLTIEQRERNIKLEQLL